MQFVLKIIVLVSFISYSENTKSRAKRTFVFTRGSAFGYLAAVAIPLNTPTQNTYLAFNFEANYGLPTNDSYNEAIKRWNLHKPLAGVENNVTNINGRRIVRSLYTRISFYRSLTGYFERFQMNGTGCVLRTICEASKSNIDEGNGLIGTIFKILFMPTASARERTELPLSFYKAEEFGSKGDCSYYRIWCPTNFLELISTKVFI